MAETLYAPLSLFRAFLSLPAADDSRDDLLVLALRAATQQVERDTGRRFGLDGEASARVFEVAGPRGGLDLFVDDIGDVEGLVVELGSGGSWTVVDAAAVTPYPLGAGVAGGPFTSLRRAAGWPVGYLVRVTARWGWPSVPEDVVLATMIRAAQLFKRKDSSEGILGAGDWGVVRVSARVDPDYSALIGRYSRGPVFA